jgi:hypothetical protein
LTFLEALLYDAPGVAPRDERRALLTEEKECRL